MHRLAAGNVPPGASSPRTQKSFQTDVSPGGYSSLARRFLVVKFQIAKTFPMATFYPFKLGF